MTARQIAFWHALGYLPSPHLAERCDAKPTVFDIIRDLEQIKLTHAHTYDPARLSFLHLPYELRSKIYENAFHAPNGNVDVSAPTGWFYSKPIAPGLALTNRLVHRESTPFLYSSNLLRLSSLEVAKKFLMTIGPQKSSHIRHLRIDAAGRHEEWAVALQELMPHGLEGLEIFGLRNRPMVGRGFAWPNEVEGCLVETIKEVLGKERVVRRRKITPHLRLIGFAWTERRKFPTEWKVDIERF